MFNVSVPVAVGHRRGHNSCGAFLKPVLTLTRWVVVLFFSHSYPPALKHHPLSWALGSSSAGWWSQNVPYSDKCLAAKCGHAAEVLSSRDEAKTFGVLPVFLFGSKTWTGSRQDFMAFLSDSRVCCSCITFGLWVRRSLPHLCLQLACVQTGATAEWQMQTTSHR